MSEEITNSEIMSRFKILSFSRVKISLLAFLSLCWICSFSCFGCDSTGSTDRNEDSDNNKYSSSTTIKITPEKKKNLRNPLTGWVMYASGNSPSNFWTNYDNMIVPELSNPVKVSDYANTCYIRTSWTILNPQEGVYGWDTNPSLKALIQEVRNRDMRLAFRVVVDSRDKGTNFTPQYVFDAGAKYYLGNSEREKCPYPDDAVFQREICEVCRSICK